ncbi:hypothetical protein BH18ACI4_BH18ACI4_28710 [soil metagenome]
MIDKTETDEPTEAITEAEIVTETAGNDLSLEDEARWIAADQENHEHAEIRAPRFTVTVQMDGSPASVTLLDGVLKGFEQGEYSFGPDLVILTPQHVAREAAHGGAERAGEQPVSQIAETGLQFSTTLYAIPDGIACAIGSIFIKLPSSDDLSGLRDDIARSNAALNINLPAEIDDAREAAKGGTGQESATVAAFKSRIAHIEGALISSMMTRLDERLAALPTREDLSQLATKDDVDHAVAGLLTMQPKRS